MANQSGRPRLHNPFRAHTRRGLQNTLKYAAWEVLSDFPQGLHISLVAKEVQQRGLRDLSRMRKAPGLISSELVRAKEIFCRTEPKTWKLRAFDGNGVSETVSGSQRQTQPRGDALVGHRVAVWWKGERRYFEGVIERYDSETKEYSVVYDDGDTDDNLKLHKYTVMYREGKIDVVTVNEHNLDDATDTTSEGERRRCTLFDDVLESKASKDVSEWSVSLGQLTGSLDSTTCGEFSESALKGNRDTRTSKRGPRRPKTNKKTNRRETEPHPKINQTERIEDISTGALSGPPVAINMDKSLTTKRSHSWEDEKHSKKTRITPLNLSPMPLRVDPLHSRAAGSILPGREPIPLGHSGIMGFDHLILERERTSNRPTRELPVVHTPSLMVNMDNVCVAKQKGFTGHHVIDSSLPKDSKQGALSSALPIPIAKNETIDVLDLKRQLQPPEDRRPDLKNLEDVGPLMTLAELSDELRGMKESELEDQEVMSRYRDCLGTDSYSLNGEAQLKAAERNLQLCRNHPISFPALQISKPVDMLLGSGMQGIMPPICQRGTATPLPHIQGKFDPSTKQPFSVFARFGAHAASVGRRHELLSPSILSTHPTVAKPEDVAPSMTPVSEAIQTQMPIVSVPTSHHPISASKRPDRNRTGEELGKKEDKHLSIGSAAAEKSSFVSVALDHMPSRQLSLFSPETETGSQSTQSSRTSMKRPWDGGCSIAGV